MIIEGDEKVLAEILMLLKQARIKAKGLSCRCEYKVCECENKDKIISDIEMVENNIKSYMQLV